MGEVFQVCRGNVGVVAGSPSTYEAWESSGMDTSMGDHGPRRIFKNIKDGFSKYRGAKYMSSQGILGTDGDAYSNKSTLPPPTCQRHSDHNGGGQPPPPPVPPVRHYSALEVLEWAARHP